MRRIFIMKRWNKSNVHSIFIKAFLICRQKQRYIDFPTLELKIYASKNIPKAKHANLIELQFFEVDVINRWWISLLDAVYRQNAYILNMDSLILVRHYSFRRCKLSDSIRLLQNSTKIRDLQMNPIMLEKEETIVNVMHVYR